MKAKGNRYVPHQDYDALYETIMQHKKGTAAQLFAISKAMLGIKTDPRA